MLDPIIAEELTLLEQVRTALDASPATAPPSEESVVQGLERLREMMSEGAKPKTSRP